MAVAIVYAPLLKAIQVKGPSAVTAKESNLLASMIRPLREVNNWAGLVCLMREYLTLAAILGVTIGFDLNRQAWGIPWGWNVALLLLAIVLIGAVQHRLAGLGHEATHYTLFKNKLLNELVSDWLCMFPLFATTHQYRLVHMAHHQFPNDWSRDPDLTTIGHSKLMHEFPMSRGRFVYNYFVRFFFPHVLFRYIWDVLSLSALGGGSSPYVGANEKRTTPFATRMGVVYLLTLSLLLIRINQKGGGPWLFAVPALWLATGWAIIAVLPQSAFFRSPMRCVYSARTTAAMRLMFFTLIFSSFAWLRAATGVNYGVYFWICWVVPLFTTFAYFMLLRDVYQHANADTGRLTNTRVFYNDPFTTWAVWVYGMDMHVPHHLFPAVPHYNLKRLHRLLRENNADYAEHVVECHGTFSNRTGQPTVLDVMQAH